MRYAGPSKGRLNRREALRGIAGGLAAAALPARSALALELLTDAARPDLKILSGAGGNVVVVATSAGPIVVDSGGPESAADVVRAVGTPDGKAAVLVNTHWHREQTGANEALGRAGTPIVAHAKTRQRLAAGWYVPAEDRYEPPLPPAGRPTRTFYDTETLEIGGRRVELGYLIEAHTDGDVFVRFPDLNVVAAGDVVSPQRDPVLDWFGGGWIGGRIDALARLLSLGDAETRYVPSYGPVVGRAEVQAEHDLMLAIFERMVVDIRLGRTPGDMLREGVLDGLPRTFEDPATFVYAAHKGLWAHHNKLMHDIV
jgi:glyoxylase-like metal-dependent hydrolase (beta-lactamase superfamily II)